MTYEFWLGYSTNGCYRLQVCIIAESQGLPADASAHLKSAATAKIVHIVSLLQSATKEKTHGYAGLAVL